MSNAYLFTSESVSEGHPDKVADQISDAVLDAILKEDPRGRVSLRCQLLRAWRRALRRGWDAIEARGGGRFG